MKLLSPEECLLLSYCTYIENLLATGNNNRFAIILHSRKDKERNQMRLKERWIERMNLKKKKESCSGRKRREKRLRKGEGDFADRYLFTRDTGKSRNIFPLKGERGFVLPRLVFS
jgi:hypothetical protein